MKNIIYYILVLSTIGIFCFLAYSMSMLSYFSISGFHSSSPCNSIIYDGFNLNILNEKYKDSILFAIKLTIITFLSMYFLLKYKLQGYKIAALSFSSIMLVFMLFNFYLAKKDGLMLIEECTNKINIIKPIPQQNKKD